MDFICFEDECALRTQESRIGNRYSYPAICDLMEKGKIKHVHCATIQYERLYEPPFDMSKMSTDMLCLSYCSRPGEAFDLSHSWMPKYKEIYIGNTKVCNSGEPITRVTIVSTNVAGTDPMVSIDREYEYVKGSEITETQATFIKLKQQSDSFRKWFPNLQTYNGPFLSRVHGLKYYTFIPAISIEHVSLFLMENPNVLSVNVAYESTYRAWTSTVRSVIERHQLVNIGITLPRSGFVQCQDASDIYSALYATRGKRYEMRTARDTLSCLMAHGILDLNMVRSCVYPLCYAFPDAYRKDTDQGRMVNDTTKITISKKDLVVSNGNFVLNASSSVYL